MIECKNMNGLSGYFRVRWSSNTNRSSFCIHFYTPRWKYRNNIIKYNKNKNNQKYNEKNDLHCVERSFSLSGLQRTTT